LHDLPATFRAFVAERSDDAFRRGVREFAASDLPPGDVVVRVRWSGVNYKDGLATRRDGRVARADMLVPGIDLAGTVVSSAAAAFHAGDEVIAHGYDIGVAHHGGYAEYARVPGAWVMPLPAGLTARDAMAIGTAGFTAAMGLQALEERGLSPASGPVLVTGASGGLGRNALAILASRGYEAWASTGKPDEADRLRELGAAGVIDRAEVTGPGVTGPGARPLESARWAGAIDSVGGPTLPYVLRTLRTGGAVAACGNAGGAEFSTTVLPFILRGVALLGMDSVTLPIDARRRLWERLATDYRPRGLGEDVTEVELDSLEPALDGVLEGRARGRWLVKVSG
jgi:acrylyl-CoA reductase (NADPH)